MSQIPEIFVFDDVAKANAEVERLYRAVSASGNAILGLYGLVPNERLFDAQPILDGLTDALDAISTERERAS